MKKFAAIAVAASMFALAACGEKAAEEATTEAPAAEEAAAEEAPAEEPAAEEAPAEEPAAEEAPAELRAWMRQRRRCGRRLRPAQPGHPSAGRHSDPAPAPDRTADA